MFDREGAGHAEAAAIQTGAAGVGGDAAPEDHPRLRCLLHLDVGHVATGHALGGVDLHPVADCLGAAAVGHPDRHREGDHRHAVATIDAECGEEGHVLRHLTGDAARGPRIVAEPAGLGEDVGEHFVDPHPGLHVRLGDRRRRAGVDDRPGRAEVEVDRSPDPCVDRDVVGDLGQHRRPRLADDRRRGAVDEGVGLGAAAELDRHLVALDDDPAAHLVQLLLFAAVELDPVLALVGAVGELLDHPAHSLLGEPLALVVELVEAVEADFVDQRGEPALTGVVGGDHAAHVVEDGPRHAHVGGEELFPLRVDPALADDPGPGEGEGLGVGVEGAGGEARDGRAADVEDVLVDVAPGEDLVVVEERHHDPDVPLVDRAGAVRVVADEGVPGGDLLGRDVAEHGFDSGNGGGHVEGDVAGEGELLDLAVEDAGAEVLRLGDDRRPRGAHQGDRHLAGDVPDRLLVDLDVDELEAAGPGGAHGLIRSFACQTLRRKLKCRSRSATAPSGT